MPHAAQADVPVTDAPSLRDFANRFQAGSFHGHRSGLIDRPDGLFAPSANPAPGEAGRKALEARRQSDTWRDRGHKVLEYNLDASQARRVETFLRSRPGLEALSERKARPDGVVSFRANTNDSLLFATGKILDTLPRDSLVSQALLHARQVFAPWRDSLEFDNLEWERLSMGQTPQDTSNVVISLRLRARRIFDGGIVLGNASYAYVVVDGKGRLKEVEAKWPELRSVPAAGPVRDLPTAWSDARRLFSEQRPILNQAGDSRDFGQLIDYRMVSAELTAAALAWIPAQANGKQVLAPAWSFQGRIRLNTGESILHTENFHRLTEVEKETALAEARAEEERKTRRRPVSPNQAEIRHGADKPR